MNKRLTISIKTIDLLLYKKVILFTEIKFGDSRNNLGSK